MNTIEHDRVVEKQPEQVTFVSGPAVLAGSLWLPDTDGDVSQAIVMVHGSGAVDRNNDVLFKPIREHLVNSGIAVLGYDKRGVGASTGNLLGASLFDLADDAQRAVEYLVHRDDLRFGRVGLFGHSQGGWIVPIVASRSAGVGWIVINSGPGVAPSQQVLFDLRTALQEDGFPWVEVESACASVASLLNSIREGAAQTTVNADFRRLQFEKWSDRLPIEAADLTTPWKEFLGFEPAPVLERVRCPVLALFGEGDRLVPVGETIAALIKASNLSGNAELTIKVFPGVDHRIQTGDRVFAAGYLELLVSWIRQHAG